MAWSVIRRATVEDAERLEASAARFVARHSVELAELGVCSIDDTNDHNANAMGMVGSLVWRRDRESRIIERERLTYLANLWRACMRRALREPNADGIAWDTVGFWVE